MRLNSFTLSLYPFLFHICFMMIFWLKDNKVLVYVELICMSVFFLGSVHHSLTLLYMIAAFLIRTIKNICKTDKVSPKVPGVKEKEKESPSSLVIEPK